MPREIVLRPRGKLAAAWLDRIAIESGSLLEGRQVVAEDVGRVTVKDTDVPGLEMRLTASGVRSWAVSKRVNGIQRRFTLPEGARLSLAEARRNAIKLLDAIADGRDPTAERRETRKRAQLARLGIGRAWTLEALIEEYGAKVAAPAKQKSWLDRRAHILREFLDLAALPVPEITNAHLWRVLDAATARGAQVSGWHALRYLRTVLAWALSRKLIDRDPTADLPLKDIRGRMKERTRDRVLSPAELGRLWRALEASPGDVRLLGHLSGGCPHRSACRRGRGDAVGRTRPRARRVAAADQQERPPSPRPAVSRCTRGDRGAAPPGGKDICQGPAQGREGAVSVRHFDGW
jgi:hypothetical protein